MKTADLIPFILLELKESDKYGLEITKNIETKSNGLLIIKQPTLYTILKKLEKSKFISSYWEDSEIGGKRHYYKLTENGKLQVSTLPTYQELFNSVTRDNELTGDNVEENHTENQKISIMDALLETPTPTETILPTNEVFADNSIDSVTTAEINAHNIDILRSETQQKHEEFAENTEVAKFTEQKEVKIPQEIKAKLTENQDKLEILHVPSTFTSRLPIEEVKYVDFVDIKSSATYKKSKKITRNTLIKTLCTSAYLLMAVIVSTLATAKSGTSSLFYVFMIAGIIGAIFYPLTFIFIMDKFRLNVQNKEHKLNLKLSFFVSFGIFLFVLVLSIFVNIAIGNGSIVKLFSIDNFANFYAPLFISSSVFADYLFNYLLMKKLLK